MSTHNRSSALKKALAVLQAISEKSYAVGLPDLAAQLGLPRQTVHRVLGQLESLKLVIRDPSRERYSVGPHLSALALATLRSLNQSAPIRVILQDLVDDIGENCGVGVLEDLDYVYLHRIECRWPLRLQHDLGVRVPAHCMSGGKVLLAHLDPELSRRLLKSRKLKACTSNTITRVADLEVELTKARSNGFALNNQERLDGIVGVAVPVLGADGNILASLGTHGPLPRLTLKACERHVARLKLAAERIARVWFD